MTKTHAPAPPLKNESVRLPHREAASVTKTGGAAKSPSSVFITMALDMSWKLAIAILVPILSGVGLDKALKTSPVFIIIGFVIAMAAMGFVLWQTLQTANKLPVPKLTEAQKKAIKKSYEEDDE